MVCDGANEWSTQRRPVNIGDCIPNHRSSSMVNTPSPSSPRAAAAAKPLQQPPQLKCPRCDSANTKFCYYNNYSLSQPRHFCKACKRYWTRGGTLRNVPVGGGCRKNKRAKKAAPSAAAAPSTAASDRLNSLLFGQGSAAAGVPFPALPPMYELQPQLSALGYQLGFGTGLADLQQSGGFLNTYPMPGFDQELDLQKQVKVEGETNVTGILDWQAQAQDPHEMMMSQFDFANFSLAPLM